MKIRGLVGFANRRAFQAFALLTAVLFGLTACGVAEKPKPSTEQIQQAFKLQLPEHVEITHFAVEVAEQSQGEGGIRHKVIATLSTGEPLYVQSETIGEVAVLSEQQAAGAKFEVTGFVDSLAVISAEAKQQQDWKNTFDLDGLESLPLDQTRDHFPETAVVFGTEAEQQVREAFERQQQFEQQQRETAQLQARLKAQADARAAEEAAAADAAAAEEAARLKARKDRLRAVSSGNF